MPTDPLLWDCLSPGSTSYQEPKTGLGVTLKPESGETILLFRTDCDSARQHLGLTDRPSCDVMYWYRAAHTPVVLLFVELKGGDFDHACKQLQSTLLAMRSRVDKALHARTRMRALIVSTATAPSTLKRLQRDFQGATKVALQVKSGVKGSRYNVREHLTPAESRP